MRQYQLDGEIPTLEVALSEHVTAEDLKKLAALINEKPPTRKADLVATIMRRLAGEGLRAVWQSLDELQGAAVAEVVHSSSTRFLADRFRAKYGQDPAWGQSESGYHRSPSALRFFLYGNGVMPKDLKERLRAFVPPPVETKIKTLEKIPPAFDRTGQEGTEEVPLVVRETERTAQRELLSVLRLVDAGKVAVSDKTRRASAAAIETITAVLEGGDYYPRLPATNKWHDENAGPIRAFAWPLLIQAGRLAELSGSKLQLTKAGRNALVEPAAETIHALWTKWEDTTIVDELSRIDCVKGQTGKGKHGLTAVSSRRSAVADALAECPVGGWILTDEFFRFLHASGNDFMVTRAAGNLYIAELQYGSLGYEGGERILEERYLYCLLLEYAATLGMIDVALIPPARSRDDYYDLWGTDDLAYFSRYDGLMYFRVTPLGAYCLGVESGYQPLPLEVKPVLRVLPNLEIAAIGAGLTQGDRLALDAYATQVSDRIWRLDAGRLLAAIEEGRPVEEIREFLVARNGAPIPNTVAQLLTDVADRSMKVYDRGLARLVECADPALAALIANDPRTRRHCMRAGEQHLVVPASSEAAFKRMLREVGYLLAIGRVQPMKDHHANSTANMTQQASDASVTVSGEPLTDEATEDRSHPSGG